MYKITHQGTYFAIISGIGWCMDMGIYAVFTSWMSVPVAPANMLSSLPAITFVFIMATRHIFATQENRLGLRTKYVIYLGYQAALVTLISLFAGWIYVQLQEIVLPILLVAYLNILVKCLITPITMLCNFWVMKFLAERC